MKKVFKNSKLKRFLGLIVLFSIYVFICAFSYANAVSTNISNSVFRLHVIANSDTKEDQNLKYLVRDALIEYMNSISNKCISRKEAISIAESHKDDFYKIANQVIRDNGYNYDVNINIGNFAFPTKNYGDISLPAGYYDALRVEIGNANGQNWWCVMFPPMCLPAAVAETELSDVLEKDEVEIVEGGEKYKLKFKIVEIYENLAGKFK